MNDNTVFENLVSELTCAERSGLLGRIRSQAMVSAEALFEGQDQPEDAHADYDAHFRTLTLFQKIVIMLRSFFSGRPREDIFRDDAVSEIVRFLVLAAPGIVDHKRRRLTGSFRRELAALRDASKYFRSLIDRTADKDRGDFVAFLASVEIPEVNEIILADTDPFAFEEREPGIGENAVFDSVRAALDSALAGITDSQRQSMAYDLRWVREMRKLSSFIFEHFLSAFVELPTGRWECPYPAAADLLSDLVDQLVSLSEPPSAGLVEAMILYLRGGESGSFGTEAEDEARLRMAEVETRLGVIRDFNRSIPLVKLVRVVRNDPLWNPKHPGPMDDWLSTYRDFWKARVDASLRRFKAVRSRIALEREIANFLGREPRSEYQALGSRAESVPPVSRAATLAFLDAFYRDVFVPVINRPLKIILVDGEFYKRDNRVEFADAYSELLKIDEAVRIFDARLSPIGDLSQAYVEARKEMIAIPLKKRKIETAVMGAETEAERIENGIVGALEKMLVILRGIVSGGPGGRYDSLSNLGALDGKNNNEFVKSLEKAKGSTEKALALYTALAGTADADASP
ncbi:MAG: DUF5312 family protein [Spirochaetes bacterium]|nr:DUF5312 family protein [Spirochaetota bacterium]